MSRKTSKRTATVKVVADGTNCVTLVFPKGTVLKGKKKLSVKDVSQILSAVATDVVSGQCWRHRHRPPPTAVGAVRG